MFPQGEKTQAESILGKYKNVEVEGCLAIGLRLKLAPHFVFLIGPNAKPLKANELFMLEGGKTNRILRKARRQHVLGARDRLQKRVSIMDLSDLD